MRGTYRGQLRDLSELSARMCGAAGDVLRQATRALLTTDLPLAESVMQRDAELDLMRVDAEAVAVRLLALQAPVASELRAVLAVLWVVGDLQRMGALAIHVAKAARRRHPASVLPVPVRPIIERMGKVGIYLAESAETVLQTYDLELAAGMDAQDDLMDDLQQELFRTLLDPSWSYGVGPAVDLALLGRFYERFADHAVSIGRRVVFLVTGDNVGGDTTPAAW